MLPKASVEKVVEMAFGLDKLKSIRNLTRLLAVGGKARKK